jgi:two-component system, NtrC family, sensor histidine kinase HydH
MLTKQDRLELAGIYLAIAAITALHYFTNPHQSHLHDIYRRLYYLPIILAAFLHGLRGGITAAILVCLLYAPHAWGAAIGLHGHISHDPATPTQKILEMVLYLAVGTVTGSLVSRLKRVQRRLESTADDLERSIERLRSTEERLVQEARLAAVGRLSAGLAHEIRNPLASIKGSAELLADDFGVEHPKRRLLQVLVDEAVRLNDVLTRFLAFARPAPVQRETVVVATEMETVLTLVRSGAGARDGISGKTPGGETGVPSSGGPGGAPSGAGPGVAIRFDPGGSEGLRLLVDPRQVRQVLLNVVLNAVQACGDHGEVVLRGERRGTHALLSVRDTGPGFTPEALANAFTPFFTTRSGGTGLGLAITHRIVDQHGGTIRLANRPEGGGLVEIELPCEAPLGDR